MPRTAAAAAAGPAARGSSPARPALDLDEADPGDAKILKRQRAAARAAGRQGQDRARVTRGRADLEQAFDEGTAAAAGADQDQDQDEVDQDQDDGGGPGAVARRGAASASGFLSRGSWSPALSPPGRARDAGGLAFGLLLYTAAITYIRYGPAGWKGWLSAKFLNKPMQGQPTAKGGPPVQTGALKT